MRRRLEQLLNGRFEYEVPHLLLSETEVALTLDDKRREQQESATAKAQKAVDDIAVQCWLRHKLAE
mgnify:CR=1 FL=1